MIISKEARPHLFQVKMLLAEPLSLDVIDQITKEGWEEGWQVEEVEDAKVEVKDNDIEKVEYETCKGIGGKKEELGRIPLSATRFFPVLMVTKFSLPKKFKYFHSLCRLQFLLHLLDDVRKFI